MLQLSTQISAELLAPLKYLYRCFAESDSHLSKGSFTLLWEYEIISYKRRLSWKHFSETTDFTNKNQILAVWDVTMSFILKITSYSCFCMCWDTLHMSFPMESGFPASLLACFHTFPLQKKSAKPVPFVAGTRQHVGALSWLKIQTENTVSWRACGLLGFIFKGWGQGRLLLREAESGKIYSQDLDHA